MAGIEVATGENCKDKTAPVSPSKSSDLLKTRIGHGTLACWICGYEFEEKKEGWLDCTGCCHRASKAYVLGFWEGVKFLKSGKGF